MTRIRFIIQHVKCISITIFGHPLYNPIPEISLMWNVSSDFNGQGYSIFFHFFVRSCLTRYSFSYSWCGALCYLNVCYSNSFIFLRNMYIQTFSHLKNFLYWCHIKKRWISPSSSSRITIQFSIFTLTSSYCIKMIK